MTKASLVYILNSPIRGHESGDKDKVDHESGDIVKCRNMAKNKVLCCVSEVI